MDKYITLDSTTYDKKSKTYCYWYSITKNTYTESIRTQLESQEADFRSKLLLMLINSVQLKSYKDNGINFEYVYKYSDEQLPFIRILFTRMITLRAENPLINKFILKNQTYHDFQRNNNPHNGCGRYSRCS